ncbi:hypothetical protein BDN72DRAFT_874984 [Pluteus cervinus]|uniref:Uncharacterized protein n=1 Tax=Pluteus cervinus TaxID=181527 RepID=A0ACD3BA85_9AGAR|nr:hypothetical protein BDN72DRAFT_874984 [Pluteus cervinus]
MIDIICSFPPPQDHPPSLPTRELKELRDKNEANDKVNDELRDRNEAKDRVNETLKDIEALWKKSEVQDEALRKEIKALKTNKENDEKLKGFVKGWEQEIDNLKTANDQLKQRITEALRPERNRLRDHLSLTAFAENIHNRIKDEFGLL